MRASLVGAPSVVVMVIILGILSAIRITRESVAGILIMRSHGHSVSAALYLSLNFISASIDTSKAPRLKSFPIALCYH